jgi:hypothetical protein
LAKEGRKYWITGGIAVFVVYTFVAARPIPRETIMIPQWLSSLESGYPVPLGGRPVADSIADSAADSATGPGTESSRAGEDPAAESPGAGTRAASLIPFRLGNRFGYVDSAGRLPVNRIKRQNLFLSSPYWAEYEETPEGINVLNSQGGAAFTIGRDGGSSLQGYPLYLDDRLFLIGKEMNSLSALDDQGEPLWSYDFAAPLTCVDAAAGFVLTGSLDGAVEILDRNGRRFFFFEPGGSRLLAILGCSFSRDGNRLGIISGIDDQRFLLLERYGDPERGEFRVIYHEFLEDGFRRPVHISFIDNDSRIAFERQGGIGIYDLQNRINRVIPLDGTVYALDDEGTGGVFFVMVSRQGLQKELVGISLPGTVMLKAPFRSTDAFLYRSGPRLYLGGGSALAAFELGKR